MHIVVYSTLPTDLLDLRVRIISAFEELRDNPNLIRRVMISMQKRSSMLHWKKWASYWKTSRRKLLNPRTITFSELLLVYYGYWIPNKFISVYNNIMCFIVKSSVVLLWDIRYIYTHTHIYGESPICRAFNFPMFLFKWERKVVRTFGAGKSHKVPKI